MAGVTAFALVGAQQAGAVVTTEGGVHVGLQPRELTSWDDGSVVGEFADANDGPVLEANDTYLVYWDPTNAYHGNWQHLINVFMRGVGLESGSLGNVFAVDSQYGDPAGQKATYRSSFHGAYTDTNPYPTKENCSDPAPLLAGRAITCLTGEQVQAQLKTFIKQHSLPEGIKPVATKGATPVYYLVTPPGVAVCLEEEHCSDYPGTPEEIEEIEEEKAEAEAQSEAYTEPESYRLYKQSFCSYHSAINPDAAADGDEKTVVYAVIPWIAGGEGDYHLATADQKQAYECQDGAFWLNPETHAFEKEHPKPSKTEEEARRSAEQKETEELKTAEEDFKKGLITEAGREAKRTEIIKERVEREATEREAREAREKTERPREQEPNQDGLGEDGSYDYGLADLIVSQIGVEQQNVVTDPLLNGWQDEAGNESTDECRNFFLPTRGGSAAPLEFTNAGTLFNQTFGEEPAYITDAFDLAALKSDYPGVPCLTGVSLKPEFTVPAVVNAQEPASFDGMESDITLDAGVRFNTEGKEETAYPIFKWNFGDGSEEVTGQAPGAPSLNSPAAEPCEAPWAAPCAASTYHVYKKPGTYTVTLTVTDTGGNVAVVSHLITVDEPPQVTLQPASQTVYEGEPAAFEATASGEPAPEVQWEVSTDAGTKWSDVPGASSEKLRIDSAVGSESGDEFRARFTNGGGVATSSAATLTVEREAPKPTLQPKSQAVYEGQTASFEAQAGGHPVPTVQWEVSTNGGISWGERVGATSDKLEIVGAKLSENGYEFRATFTNTAGVATTEAATLTVSQEPPKKVEPAHKQEEPTQLQPSFTPPTTPAGSTPEAAAAPAPQAAAMILPQSVRDAARKGLVIRYSVNEQVAGHFEVLLNAALAKRLGISGSRATGLAAGAAPEVVIAKAILVTTKGGRNAVHIKFSKSTATRLQRVRRVTLMLRLQVRNATSRTPLTSTVLTTATLGR